jgi:hypothetical protein
MKPLPTLTALRYVQPLREGGSLPAVVDTDDGLFVVKFRGAGQGPKALVAELIVGRLAAALGLLTPELALVTVPEPFGQSEPDPEIQDLLRASHGTNVGLRYLDGAFNFALAAAADLVDAAVATRIVWLDAFAMNIDRTHRNTNLLIHERKPWLIDHGAALYVHHDWPSATVERTRAEFPMIKDHVLLSVAHDIETVDTGCAEQLNEDVLRDTVGSVPDDLLLDPVTGYEFASGDEARDRYITFLTQRLRPPRSFVDSVMAAQAAAVHQPAGRLRARR